MLYDKEIIYVTIIFSMNLKLMNSILIVTVKFKVSPRNRCFYDKIQDFMKGSKI